jgi:ketol-acid reductoisomerase
MTTQQHVTIFGFGSQGRAQACNLRDSGWDVTVALKPGSKTIDAATSAQFTVTTNLTAAASATPFALMLCPDLAQSALWKDHLEEHLPSEAAIAFAHGYSMHYGGITPRADLDVLLAAPMCPGPALRQRYVDGGDTAFISAIAQNASGYAAARLERFLQAVTKHQYDEIKSSFAEETETDLFSEQALLCGGLSHLMLAVFDTIVAAGYNPKIAYYTCLHESRDLAQLFATKGLGGAFNAISAVARHGALTRGPRIITDTVRTTLAAMMEEIRSGQYAKEVEQTTTEPTTPWRNHLIEQIHGEVTKDN